MSENEQSGVSQDFNGETEAKMQPQSGGSDYLSEDSEPQIQPLSNQAAGRAFSQLGFRLTAQISPPFDPSNTSISASENPSG